MATKLETLVNDVLGEKERLPWMVSFWQVLTKTYDLLWIIKPDSDSNTSSNNVPEWTVKVAQAVKTFAHNVWSKDPNEHNNYIIK